MAERGYGLQLRIYTVALLRWLRLQVGGATDCFGGVYYLFLRGLDPSHPGRGIYFHRPDPAALAALEGDISHIAAGGRKP